jgi:hypothetical protein
MFSGKPLTPTAERACRPVSPNTSTNKSEQPLITFGGHAALTTTAIYANAVGEEEQTIAARMWT